MNLPIEIVNEILSYGDVEVTQKFECVLRQLKYHKSEYDYQRSSNKKSEWYYRPSTHFKLYILMKNQIKQNIYKFIFTYKLNSFYNINFIFQHTLTNTQLHFVNYNSENMFSILNIMDYQ